MNEQMIRDAYCKMRTIDNTIPDDVLDFMKDSAIEKLGATKEPSEQERQDLVRVKLFLCDYMKDNNVDYNIHKIDLIVVDNVKVITITLGRPGVFIGKAGRTFDEISTRLFKWLGPVKINLVEFNPLN